ncbi:MAG: glycosyltransferase [Clostridia bacterium]|nr:glycosyltransferase [Clostridia bacterium]
MRVLQINPFYNYGSTGKIVKDISDSLLRDGHESYICYSQDLGFEKTEGVEFFKYVYLLEKYICAFLTRIFGNRYGNVFFSTMRLKKYIKKINPDVVHIHCLNDYSANLYTLLDFLKKNKYRTVITEHAEFYHTGNCAYAFECDKWKTGCYECPRLYYAVKSKLFDSTSRNWKKMRKAFDGADNVTLVSVSEWLSTRTQASEITRNVKNRVVLNGINTSLFRNYAKEEVSEDILQFFDKKTVLFVTSSFYSPVKGGTIVLEMARKLPQYNFVILCSGQVDCLGLENVKHIDFVKDQETLAKYYSMADVTLLTSKKETFSMPVAESLCCGTPLVGFYAGGPESIAIEEYCEFVDYGNVDLLCEKLTQAMNKTFDKKKIAERAKAKYSAQTMAEEYTKVYKEIINQ